ncbi:hypothetical protein ACHAPE_005071 [Trichoderma viride]
MATKSGLPGRAAKLEDIFYAFIKGDRTIQASRDAQHFFEAVGVICEHRSAAVCMECILARKDGPKTVREAVRSNLSASFITSSTATFIAQVCQPQVEILNDGNFLERLLKEILCPPTFWTAFLSLYTSNQLKDNSLLAFASLCLAIVSSSSPEIVALSHDVESLTGNLSLAKSSSEAVRSLGYRIDKVIQVRKGSASASIRLDYSPGGRHDNDFADFRQISIFPTADEVSSKEDPFLQRLDDVFEVSRDTRALNHLGWLFRLLREDMIADLKEDLQIAWGQRKAKRKPLAFGMLNLAGYDIGADRSSKPFTLVLQCQEGINFPRNLRTNEAKKRYLEDTRHVVKHNSVGALCLGKSIIAFGSIVRDKDWLVEIPPKVGIQFTDNAGLKGAVQALMGPRCPELKFYVVDTATFAYEPILKRLKEITEIPIENAILDPSGPPSQYDPPPKLYSFIRELQSALRRGTAFDLESRLGLKVQIRDAQLESLINGLENPVGQIQGPPGTGKSFIGAIIALALMKLTDFRILVLSYTNHALDQFLEDLMKIGIPQSDMVRIGSKASTKTEPLRIDSLAKDSQFRFSLETKAMLNDTRTDQMETRIMLDRLLHQLAKRHVYPQEILDMLEFSASEMSFWDAFQVPAQEKIAGKKNKSLRPVDVYDYWVQGKELSSLGMLGATMSDEERAVWRVPPETRLDCHNLWKCQIQRDKINEFAQQAETANNHYRRTESLLKESKRDIVKSRRIIGCTTTGAAMYQSIIRAAKPDIVLVEEAGEILEAHVITALSPSVQQLILIGDHKQLRPKINNYNLSVEKGEGYDLNVSLFERLIRQGRHFTALQEQHRSHPDISQFSRILAYEELKDMPKTLNREKLRGLKERVVFVNHEHPEEQLDSVIDRRDPSSKASKKNTFEADMVLKTVKYLSQQGYRSENMVVLTPYMGQLSLLRQKLSEIEDPYLNDLDTHELVRAGLMTQAAAKTSKGRLRLSTIDNYQGEESDIVIISLARSNERGDIGFLVARERLVVLLSRARNGIILIGNMNTFLASKKGKEMWTLYFDAMKEKGFLFDGLPVHCEQHPDRSALLQKPEDFDQHCPDGGCSQLWMKHLCGKENEGCKSCAKEDEDTRRRVQRDLEMEKKRQQQQDKYRRELQEMDDEIDHHRRHMKYTQEEQDQEKELAQKKAQLQSLKETKARLDAAKSADTKPGKSSKKPQDKKPDSSDSLGPSAQEWEDMKRDTGASNGALDELMSLIGLESVKGEFLAKKSEIDLAIRQETPLSDSRFSCSLLGNPGTGKTTVARIWGKFLTSLGAIAGDCFEETTGSKLASMGVKGCEDLLEKMKDQGGGVFFIDEAYQLSSGNSPGGKAVLDYLLAEVENLRGKVTFVLAGYSKQMESFFAHNPGFPSRFPITMNFEDYTDEELRQILKRQVNRTYANNMEVEDGLDGLYIRIAARRVGRSRGKEGFGNARAIENALANVKKRQATRIRRERRSGKNPNDFLFTKEDIIGPEPSLSLQDCKAWHKLNAMVGLKEVKEQVKILLDSIKTNYQRELDEEPPIQFTLNRVFLGSPGTGKTTVAKLYGEILATLGLLSNGELVVKNPSDFIGAALGVSESQTKGILAATLGKVLVIDEAYGLYGGNGSTSDPYKTSVIDTIVADVQNVPGDDRCVILIGYQEQMEEMFQNVNPGLSRRFSVDTPFVFEDFDDDALRQVLEFKLKASGFTTTGEGKTAALDVLIRERNRANFGNGGAIENLLSKAKASYQKRVSDKKLKKKNQIEAEDFDADFDRTTRKDTNVRALFQDDIGREEIIEKLEHIQQQVRQLKSLEMDVREEIPFNFLFRGPPGTGKTTTARKMGKVYYDMGFLDKAIVEECSATDLIGQYVGQTGPKVQKVLEKSLGRVLLIDEAYRFAEGGFAKEAIDEIVDCVTKPKYQGKLIIILAGYEHDINRLLSVNPGLTSRFPETIDFKPLEPDACFQLLVDLLRKRKVELASKGKDMDISCLERPSDTFLANSTATIKSLTALEGWASARDVKQLAKNVFSTINLKAKALKVEEEQVTQVLDHMLKDRQSKMIKSTPRALFDGAVASSHAPVTPANPALSIRTNTNIETQQKTQEDDAIDAEESDEGAPTPPESPRSSHNRKAVRDAGVSDEVWDQLQKDQAEEERKEAEYLKLKKAAQNVATDEAREKIVRLIIEEEKQREEEAKIRKKLEALGVCPVGYHWIKQADGYRCAGGSHWLSNGDINSHLG